MGTVVAGAVGVMVEAEDERDVSEAGEQVEGEDGDSAYAGEQGEAEVEEDGELT